MFTINYLICPVVKCNELIYFHILSQVLFSFFKLILFFFFFATENSEGKYLSPFHDIPLVAETEEVSFSLDV